MGDMKEVFTITERGDKKYWNRIGTAFVNSDGSLNVILDALPMNGKLNIRDPKPRDDDSRSGHDRGGQRTAPQGNRGGRDNGTF